METICAIATAQGGAIGVIRVSGDNALAATSSIFSKRLEDHNPRTLVYGNIVDKGGNVIDEVLATYFRAPHSYTGEDSTEIMAHGSPYILKTILQLLIDAGCRMARPGEYTQRAFMNGKMDLTQAEAVADLIASSSAATHRMAMGQMRGNFSKRLSELREKLLTLTSLMELELDFSDHEELEFADRSELKALSAEIESEVSRLASSFSLGNAIKNGVPVAIVGETNAGKSTLLNALVGEERAIVSDIHGTTRDVIEDTVNIDGTLFRFIDTAGIRNTSDKIERMGIERTFSKIGKARIVILLIDETIAETQLNDLMPKLRPLCNGKTLIVAHNKCDLAPHSTLHTPHSTLLTPHSTLNIKLSAKTGEGIPALKKLLTSIVTQDSLPSGEGWGGAIPSEGWGGADTVIVSNIRHYEALTKALEAIHRMQDGLTTGLPTDLVAQDLRDCLSALADITGGEITTEETLTTIFSRFCVGK